MKVGINSIQIFQKKKAQNNLNLISLINDPN